MVRNLLSKKANPNEVKGWVSLSGSVSVLVQVIRDFKSSVGAWCWNEGERVRGAWELAQQQREPECNERRNKSASVRARVSDSTSDW